MRTIRKIDWNGTHDKAIYTARNTIEFKSFPLGNRLIYLSLDAAPIKAGESTVYSYNLFDTQKRTAHKMNIKSKDVAYVCSYAELKNGYVLAVNYNRPSSVYMHYAYVTKENFNDFENKMILLDCNV